MIPSKDRIQEIRNCVKANYGTDMEKDLLFYIDSLEAQNEQHLKNYQDLHHEFETLFNNFRLSLEKQIRLKDRIKKILEAVEAHALGGNIENYTQLSDQLEDK